MVVTAIGWRAHAALLASGGRAEILAPLSTSAYATAAGELIWIGPSGIPLHPRSVTVSAGTPLRAGDVVSVDLGVTTAWRPAPLPDGLPEVREAGRMLDTALCALGPPRGLASLIAPLDDADATAEANARAGNGATVAARARPHARALARACAEESPRAAVEAARPLLGLGTGLTPSGDDYVGGALFARRVLPTCDRSGWDAAIAGIVDEATTRTHPISATLLRDLACGESWAPLHDLASALHDADDDHCRHAARELSGIGSTSGWDILAGFLAVLALAAGARRPERRVRLHMRA
jgi:hypothetical protein